MFDHVKFGVSDYAASKAFFLRALEPLGVAVVSEGPPTYGVELSPIYGLPLPYKRVFAAGFRIGLQTIYPASDCVRRRGP
jgi:catechol 2,3-dioxygenase-like lactoylglutathione lyase family enzyme